MLRDVKSTVTDNLLGLGSAKGTGVHLKIGVSPVVSDTPLVITGYMTAARIKDQLGMSPLTDAVMDSVENGSNLIYCLPVSASTAGTISEVAKTGSGSGTMTVEGSPSNAFDISVKITGQGALNSALFSVSIDGGSSYGDELTIPMTGDYEIPQTGVKLKFTNATDETQVASSFLVNDSYSFTTTAPTMTNADVLGAIDKLKNFNQAYEFIHIVGASTSSLWSAVSTAQVDLRDTYHKPMFILMEAVKPDKDADLGEYILNLNNERKKVANYDLCVCASWSLYVKMDGTTQEINNAGIAAGLFSRTNVQESVGKTRDSANLGISKNKMLELRPAGIEEYIDMLDDADFLTFCEYDGLNYFYVYHAKMLSPEGSDYRYAEDSRVKNKIIRETRKEGLQLLNDDIDLEDVQGELETRGKFLFNPLQKMIDAKEISSATIIIPEDQADEIIESETMNVTVRYVSRGYIREVDIDLGRTKPAE